MEQVVTCTECDLHAKCSGPVALAGDTPSRVAVMGESPGTAEDEAGLLFVGAAGVLLRDALGDYESIIGPYAMLNVVSCASGGTPTKKHVNACAENRTAQLRVIEPEYVLVLGTTAAKAMAPSIGEIEYARQHPFEMDGRVYVPALHPAAAMRDGVLKEQFLEDVSFFAEVIINGRSWATLIPDSCSSCASDQVWISSTGLGYCEVHLPDLERQARDAWEARKDAAAYERLEEPTPGTATARADAEARTASSEWREAAGLSDPDENDVQLRGGARPTEKAAASAVFPKTGTQRRAVLDLIAGVVPDGRTDQEIERELGIRPSSASTRRAELERGGWVKDGQTRRLTAAGNEAIVWMLTDEAKAALA